MGIFYAGASVAQVTALLFMLRGEPFEFDCSLGYSIMDSLGGSGIKPLPDLYLKPDELAQLQAALKEIRRIMQTAGSTEEIFLYGARGYASKFVIVIHLLHGQMRPQYLYHVSSNRLVRIQDMSGDTLQWEEIPLPRPDMEVAV
jgi:hypothetical protein